MTGNGGLHPCGGHFRSCFHDITFPRTSLPPLYSSSQSPIHQSRQHLHISQQINVFNTTPAESWVKLSVEPPLLPPSSHSATLHSSLTHFPLVFHWFMSVVVLRDTELASFLVQKSLQRLAWHIASQRNSTCVFRIHTGSNPIEYSAFRSIYLLAEEPLQGLDSCFHLFICYTFPLYSYNCSTTTFSWGSDLTLYNH